MKTEAAEAIEGLIEAMEEEDEDRKAKADRLFEDLAGEHHADKGVQRIVGYPESADDTALGFFIPACLHVVVGGRS
jgi:rhamnogalacturonyl hydrolase YesR